MATNLIQFPMGRVTRVFTDTLPDDATPKEEAIFHVRRARAIRASANPTMRAYHTAGIILAWWERELASLIEEAA